eukprot:gene7426-14680_t
MGELAPIAGALTGNPATIDGDLSQALRTVPIDTNMQQQVIAHARSLEQGLVTPGVLVPDPSNPTCRWATGLSPEATNKWLDTATTIALGLSVADWSPLCAAATIVLLGPSSSRIPQQQEFGRQLIEDCRHVPLDATVCNVPGHVRPTEGEPGCNTCTESHVRELLALLHDAHPSVLDAISTPERRTMVSLQCHVEREMLWQQSIAAAETERLQSAMAYVTNTSNWTYVPTSEQAANGVTVFFGIQCREGLIKSAGCNRTHCDRVHGVVPMQRAAFPHAKLVDGEDYKRLASSSLICNQGIPAHPYHRKICLNHNLGRCTNANCSFTYNIEQYGLDASHYSGCKWYYDRLRDTPPA